MTSRYAVIYPDAAALAHATAARVLTHLTDVLALKEVAHLSLTGGSVGTATLREIGESPLRHNIDWNNVHLWWSDERFLPAGDLERNEVQAHAALITELPIPAANVHVIAPQSDEVPTAEVAAELYAAELASFAAADSAAPQFDVLLLGMGPDAHVASLFPEHEALAVAGVSTSAVHNSPKPPSTRVTFTFETINNSTEVWIVAAGAEKAEAVSQGLSGAAKEAAPVANVRGTAKTLWLLDTAASNYSE